jgi:hypothetical protein
MSAFMVSKVHLDFLLTAAMHLEAHPPFDWYLHAEPLEALLQGAHERGQPWGPGAIGYAGARRRTLTPETADFVGTMLWAENRASVNHRYDEAEEVQWYTFTPHKGPFDPVQVLKSVRCYDYQSCEHPEWEQSEAKSFCDSLTITAIYALPGMDDAVWGAPGE